MSEAQPTEQLWQSANGPTGADADQRFRRLFEAAPIGMALLAPGGHLLSVNRALCHILGRTEAELLALAPAELVGLDSELRIEDPSGDSRHYDIVWYPLRAERGEPSTIAALVIDITEHRRSDAEHDRALRDFEEAQRIARVGSWSYEPETGGISWSREMYRIHGRDVAAGPLPVAEFLASVVPEDRAAVAAAYRELYLRGAPFEADYRVVGDDGIERAIHAFGRRDPDHGGAFSGIEQDVSELRATERMLRAAETRFRSAFEHAPVGMAIHGLDGRYQQVNDALCEILGYTQEDLLATSFRAITHPEDVDGDEESLTRLLAGDVDHVEREKRCLRANGEPVWVSVHATLLRNRDARPQQFLVQVVDITERRRLESRLRHLADHDPLTGLLNRRGLEAELERHMARINRYGARGALLVLDLDHFKTVNDTFGHDAGDQLIVSVATLLGQRLRASDTVARLGGDEFAILLPEADADDARRVAEEIVAAIRETAVVVGGQAARQVTASIGVTLFRGDAFSAEEALVDADLAMYDAKEAGRDRFAIYRPAREDGARTKARLAWIDRIREALDHERLTLYAQPIVELATGEIRRHELLLRMIDGAGESIPPGAFLYIAERYDLIQELDRWVVSQAIRLLERRQGLGVAGGVEINVSAKSLADDALAEQISRELAASPVDPALLVFEVAETAAVANIHLARRFAERLAELGCHFALDDFGAGFGSFYHLKHIPFDHLKIDGEFVTACLGSRTDQLVIESFVTIARGLEKQTIAEGVEDAATLAFLRRAGVDFAQGYHIGAPVPVVGSSLAHDVAT